MLVGVCTSVTLPLRGADLCQVSVTCSLFSFKSSCYPSNKKIKKSFYSGEYNGGRPHGPECTRCTTDVVSKRLWQAVDHERKQRLELSRLLSREIVAFGRPIYGSQNIKLFYEKLLHMRIPGFFLGSYEETKIRCPQVLPLKYITHMQMLTRKYFHPEIMIFFPSIFIKHFHEKSNSESSMEAYSTGHPVL